MAGLVFDASVVIALLETKDPHHQAALRFYLDSMGETLYLASITYAEVLATPDKHNKLGFYVKNLANAGFEVMELSQKSAINLAKTRSRSGLKMPDACVLALAQEIGCSLVTADKQLAAAAKKSKVPAVLLQ